MNWIYNYENRIYTIVKTKATKELKTDYPDIFFTMDSEPSDTTNHFPTVLIHHMPVAEKGQTLDGLGINAFISTIQIDVVSSKSQNQNTARLVIWEVIEQFKKLRYEMVLSPEILNTGNDTNRVVARMRRMVGANDIVG